MKLYLFNPDADLALADGGTHYIPPASARQMARDLAILPAWYASPGSGVLAPSAYNDIFMEQMSVFFQRNVHLVTEPELSEHTGVLQPMPWGWNAAVRRRLLYAGLTEAEVPTEEQLARWRELASRERVEQVLEVFSGWDNCVGESRNLHSLEACRSYVDREDGTVLKAPWSGSGKGLLWCRGGFSLAVEGWCMRVLRTQGCVVASPIYDKVLDFALEFYADGNGGISFEGYSLFETNERGAYQGNWLLGEHEAEDYLGMYVSREGLHRIRRTLEKTLAHGWADYAGYLGVDMMVCRTEDAHGTFAVHPCVEVNLRMNMGVVAGCLQRRLLAPGTAGRFQVEYFPSTEVLHARHTYDQVHAPLVVRDGRVLEGYLSLVPVTPSARYRAFVRVSSSGYFPDTVGFRCHSGQ